MILLFGALENLTFLWPLPILLKKHIKVAMEDTATEKLPTVVCRQKRCAAAQNTSTSIVIIFLQDASTVSIGTLSSSWNCCAGFTILRYFGKEYESKYTRQ